jgi:uracil phosphoribosyltransferase
MGASGVTMNDAVTLYKNHAKGPPRRIIALHLIVTPEYLRALRQTHPDVLIFAFRVDRGNSTADVLQSQLGACEALEQGLNEQQYIVPGAGGLGEVLNHCET